jgi:hypothetical protein
MQMKFVTEGENEFLEKKTRICLQLYTLHAESLFSSCITHTLHIT